MNLFQSFNLRIRQQFLQLFIAKSCEFQVSKSVSNTVILLQDFSFRFSSHIAVCKARPCLKSTFLLIVPHCVLLLKFYESHCHADSRYWRFTTLFWVYGVRPPHTRKTKHFLIGDIIGYYVTIPPWWPKKLYRVIYDARHRKLRLK